MGASARRVAVIGIDCLTPQLVFDQHLDQLPFFHGVVERGVWGKLRSTVPPITIPAWLCMASSQDPGQLGLYGFRNRTNHSYGELSVADASWLRAPTLWQLLSRKRRRSLVVGVPLTYPPRPILGDLVSGVPVPADAEVYTAPKGLRAELDEIAGDGGYIIDVGDFRTRSPEDLAQALAELRENRFDVVEALAARREWDLLFMVEMSVDRLHHAFWAHADPAHPLHDPETPFRHLLRDFYIALDARIGRFVESLGDDTAVLVVSDHGAKTMKGGVRFNEWLVREGLLTLKARPPKLGRLKPEMIDWSKTKAWADGGYYTRVFCNVKGREPEGVVEDCDAFVAELKGRFETMAGPGGAPLGNRVFVPKETYQACENVAPDLIVYPGDLDYRANAQVFPDGQVPAGDEALFPLENDTGVDGANHAQHGVWCYRPAKGEARAAGRNLDAEIYDIAPTVLSLLGEEPPAHMIGRVLDLTGPQG